LPSYPEGTIIRYLCEVNKSLMEYNEAAAIQAKFLYVLDLVDTPKNCNKD